MPPSVLCSIVLAMCLGTACSLRRCSPLLGSADVPEGLNLTALFESEEPDAKTISSLVAKATAKCKDPHILADFRVSPHWARYSLADMWRGAGYYVPGGLRDAKSYACGNSSFQGHWPDSLYCDFRHEYPTYNGTLTQELLCKFLKERAPEIMNEGLVVHIRMGDVIDSSNDTVETMLKSPTFFRTAAACRKFVMPARYYVSAAAGIDHQLVTFVGSPHGNPEVTYRKSCVYTHAIAALFQKSGHTVKMRVGKPPDEDFLFMANSRLFLPSGGGFSQLLQTAVQCNGGKVLKS